ncbi:MAG TPA: ATP-binding protein [Candidatus Cloacimonadota bacterium]|nr:ATP-binding protein [Candidatus Cloacimonadota bacterium]HQL14550.1 ATP-binding protein [Candidatus Cloacimonadota bacterium]
MADYWNIVPAFEERAKKFLANKPEAEVTLQFEIECKDFVNAGKGSAELKNVLKRLGIDSAVIRRVAVASYEAEINVAAHSVGGTMFSYVYDDLVYIKFVDKGPGISNIEQAMLPGWSTADELVREMGFGAGLGLPNIQKNSDLLHIISDAGKNTMVEIIIFYA